MSEGQNFSGGQSGTGAGFGSDKSFLNELGRTSAQNRGSDTSSKKASKNYKSPSGAFDVAAYLKRGDDAATEANKTRLRLARKGYDITDPLTHLTVVWSNVFAALMSKNPEMELAF